MAANESFQQIIKLNDMKNNFECPYPSNSIIKVKDKQITYYLPCYLRMKMKNLNKMDLKLLSANLNATMLITVYYGNLPLEIAEQIKENFSLGFQRDDILCMGEKSAEVSSKIKQKQKIINFTIRKAFGLSISSDVRYSPFQLLYLILTIKVNSFQVKWTQNQKVKRVQIRFTLMDAQNNLDGKLSFGNERMKFGNYRLAQKMRQVHYTNISTYTEFLQNKESKDHFHYVHFVIPFYKLPGVPLMVIFLPLLLLSIINLGVFFQNFTISERVESIAVLVIAFVAILPIIRQQIPPIAVITLIQLLVYWATLGSVFSLVETFRVRGESEQGYMWYQISLLYVSIFITATTFLIIIIFYLIHKCYWQRRYTDKDATSQDKKLDQTQWNSYDKNENYQKWLKKLQIKQKPKKEGSMSPQQRAKMKKKIVLKFYKVPSKSKLIVSKNFFRMNKEIAQKEFRITISNFIENSRIDALLLQGISKSWINEHGNYKKMIDLEEMETKEVEQEQILLNLVERKKVLCQPKVSANADYTIVFNHEKQAEFAIIYRKDSFNKFYSMKKLQQAMVKSKLQQLFDKNTIAWVIVDDIILISCQTKHKNQILSRFQNKQPKMQLKLHFIAGMNNKFSLPPNQNSSEIQISQKMQQQDIGELNLNCFDAYKKCSLKKMKDKKKK